VLEFHVEAPQATTSEGLAQGPYLAARVGFESATLRSKDNKSTNEARHPTYFIVHIVHTFCGVSDCILNENITIIIIICVSLDKVSPPFYQVKLSSTADDCLMDLAWNPGPEFSSMFAACLSDGSVCLYEMKNTTLSILASLKGNAQATCRKFLKFSILTYTA